MRKKKEFPPEVLQVLKDMEGLNDSRLPTMQKVTRNEDALKNMWRHILRSEKQSLYACMNQTEVVYSFIDSVVRSMKKEIPVFYFDEKEKADRIKKICRAQKKLKEEYIKLFAEEAAPFIKVLQENEATAIKKIKDSYLRASGDPKTREIHTFIRGMAQQNLWTYGEHLPSVIRTLVLAVYGYTINHDANILKILQEPSQPPIILCD